MSQQEALNRVKRQVQQEFKQDFRTANNPRDWHDLNRIFSKACVVFDPRPVGGSMLCTCGENAWHHSFVRPGTCQGFEAACRHCYQSQSAHMFSYEEFYDLPTSEPHK